MDRRFRPRLLDDESTLFRSLVVVLVPLCVGGGVATRAYAEPPVLALDAASELVRGFRSPLPPRVSIALGPGPVVNPVSPGPRLPPRRAPRAAPVPGPGGGLAGVLATMGNADATLFSPALEAAMDAAVARVGPEHASRTLQGVRGSQSGRGGELRTGLDESVPGVVEVGPGCEQTLDTKPRWRVAPEQAPPGTGAEQVGGVVRGARGRVESCVQTAARLEPGLSGRVELGWAVEAGRPGAVVVKENGTGNAELGQCLRRAVLSLDFGEATSLQVDSYAWVIQAVD